MLEMVSRFLCHYIRSINQVVFKPFYAKALQSLWFRCQRDEYRMMKLSGDQMGTPALGLNELAK